LSCDHLQSERRGVLKLREMEAREPMPERMLDELVAGFLQDKGLDWRRKTTMYNFRWVLKSVPVPYEFRGMAELSRKPLARPLQSRDTKPLGTASDLYLVEIYGADERT
jgi:hypothetical protein